MKTIVNFKNRFNYILIVFLALSMSSKLMAQDNKTEDIKPFKIVVEKTQKGIKLLGVKGTAWKDMSFSINDYQPQTIDEYGMAVLDNVSDKKDEKLADFLFTIIKTKEGIELKGMEGTAWTNLSFSLSKNQKEAIDQNGTASLN